MRLRLFSSLYVYVLDERDARRRDAGWLARQDAAGMGCGARSHLWLRRLIGSNYTDMETRRRFEKTVWPHEAWLAFFTLVLPVDEMTSGSANAICSKYWTTAHCCTLQSLCSSRCLPAITCSAGPGQLNWNQSLSVICIPVEKRSEVAPQRTAVPFA